MFLFWISFLHILQLLHGQINPAALIWEACFLGSVNPDLVETSFGGSSGRKCRDLAQRNSTAIGRHCLEADADKAFVKAVELVLGYREGAKCRNSKRVRRANSQEDCFINGCQNGGICIYSGNYKCVCQSGYRGKYCESRAESKYKCSFFPCKNGGICHTKMRSPYGYLCNCPAGYSGQFCETRISAPIDCRFLKDGDYADAWKCPSESFYKCANGKGWLFRCDLNTYFSTQLSRCTWRGHVNC